MSCVRVEDRRSMVNLDSPDDAMFPGWRGSTAAGLLDALQHIACAIIATACSRNDCANALQIEELVGTLAV
eukprot:1256492-Amphidinium_carterae.2